MRKKRFNILLSQGGRRKRVNETCSNVVLSGANAGREYAKIFPERFGIRAPRFGGRRSAAASRWRGFEASRWRFAQSLRAFFCPFCARLKIPSRSLSRAAAAARGRIARAGQTKRGRFGKLARIPPWNILRAPRESLIMQAKF